MSREKDMYGKDKRFYFCLLAGIIVLFLCVWFFSARSFSGWGDEITHFGTAKGLAQTGQYKMWSFDQGQISPINYTRGLVITYLASLSYKMAGLSRLAFRVIPLVFVLLTFLTLVLYIRLRHYASWKALAYAAVFFFGQVFVFEQSVYVRIYAPLGWLMVCGLILYWEAYLQFQKRKVLLGCVLLGGSTGTLILPTIDHWQMEHLAIYALAIVLSFPLITGMMTKIDQKLSVKVKILLGICLVFFALFVALILDYAMGYWVIDAKRRLMGRSFVTYWDNLAGMIRYALALNVCFIGLGWVMQDLRKNKTLDFYSWSFLTGIVSGILIGLFNPHNHIFYSRFFYVSVLLVAIGFPQMLLRMNLSKNSLRWIFTVFLVFNVGLFVINVYCERSNIRIPIAWLEKNLKQNELLIVFTTHLELHGGESLIKRAYAISPSQDPSNTQQLMNRIESSTAEDIYYLYTDEYEFRDQLYLWTMGDDRSPPNDLFRYLKEKIPSQTVMPGLRTCGLVKFKKSDLIISLQKLLQDGYPPQFKGVEKRILKKILKPWLKEKLSTS
ncbi:MAG: hypothetical protein H6753_03750 [Candidatus Omnitrophica bacterium]|nr:hypothetical protein [Candidatus Omnitrophota bacterium]